VAEAFGRDGAAVVLVDVDREGTEEPATLARQAGGEARFSEGSA
jgi:hypothetical protein